MTCQSARPSNHSKSASCARFVDEQHYLKAGRPAGHVLWQGAWGYAPESGIDRLVAVFAWAGAAKRLKDRDEWIGRDSVTCANLDVLLRVMRALIQDWSAWQALSMPKYRALPDWRPSLTWIYATAMKLRAAA